MDNETWADFIRVARKDWPSNACTTNSAFGLPSSSSSLLLLRCHPCSRSKRSIRPDDDDDDEDRTWNKCKWQFTSVILNLWGEVARMHFWIPHLGADPRLTHPLTSMRLSLCTDDQNLCGKYFTNKDNVKKYNKNKPLTQYILVYISVRVRVRTQEACTIRLPASPFVPFWFLSLALPPNAAGPTNRAWALKVRRTDSVGDEFQVGKAARDSSRVVV